MQNLLNSTEVATVFLDHELVIKRFTNQARKVFSLIDTDIGRPISDLTGSIRYEEFEEDAREVLRTLVFSEREIQTKDGSWRLMRIMPYRTSDNQIKGLVMTFIDIDRIKRNETGSERHRVFAEEALDAIPIGVAVLDAALTILYANARFYEIFRTNRKRAEGERLLPDGVLHSPELAAELSRVIPEQRELKSFHLKRKDGSERKDIRVSARSFRASANDRELLLLTLEEL
jgi:two-component system CheB/CheR fusion protein